MKELQWRPIPGSDGTKVLHWRFNPSDPWQVYTSHPLRLNDYQIPLSNGTCSKGFATAQKLLSLGWVYVPIECAVPIEKTDLEYSRSVQWLEDS